MDIPFQNILILCAAVKMHILYNSRPESSPAVQVHRCDVTVLSCTDRGGIMQPLLVDVPRLRKQALTSLQMTLKPAHSISSVPDQRPRELWCPRNNYKLKGFVPV